MGGRVISLIDYRKRRFAESARETEKGRPTERSEECLTLYEVYCNGVRYLIGSHRSFSTEPQSQIRWFADVSSERDLDFLSCRLVFRGLSDARTLRAVKKWFALRLS